jgi:hypothetical protein
MTMRLSVRPVAAISVFILLALCAISSAQFEINSKSVPDSTAADMQLRGFSFQDAAGQLNNLQPLPRSHSRTATGGFARKVLMCLSFLAFVGNGAFMVFVFWM